MDPYEFVQDHICSIKNYDCCEDNCENCNGRKSIEDVVDALDSID